MRGYSRPSRQTTAMHADDFAGSMLRIVERESKGEWFPARDAFRRAIAAGKDHPYVKYLAGNRARQIGVTAALRRVLDRDFPHIERIKHGQHRGGRVYFRTR